MDAVNLTHAKESDAMYIDRHINAREYPYQGTFYIKGEPQVPEDGDLFGETVMEEKIILETKCDVTETQRAFSSGAITASYDVYYPLEDGEMINIDRGYMFRANVDGLNIVGMVVSVGHSELGGVHAYIKSSEV